MRFRQRYLDLIVNPESKDDLPQALADHPVGPRHFFTPGDTLKWRRR